MKAMNYPAPVHYPTLLGCCVIFLFRILSAAPLPPVFKYLEEVTVVLTLLLTLTKLHDWWKKTFSKKKPDNTP